MTIIKLGEDVTHRPMEAEYTSRCRVCKAKLVFVGPHDPDRIPICPDCEREQGP